MPVILGGPSILQYEDAKSAPKRTYKHVKSQIFRGVIRPDPRIKRAGEGGEGLGGVGKGGNRCLAHPKIIPWRPL
jgi:hypothetical protein